MIDARLSFRKLVILTQRGRTYAQRWISDRGEDVVSGDNNHARIFGNERKIRQIAPRRSFADGSE